MGHHSSTDQVFKGLYGMILVTDPNEGALQASGTLPSAADTKPIVLSDTTVCKAPGSNDAATYDPSLPWVGPLDPLPAPQTGNETGALPAQPGPTPLKLCETPTAIDEDGALRATSFAAGDIPNNQTAATNGRTNEGQTVLTNGMNVGGRAGSPSAPGALASGASTLTVKAGQGLRLEILNAATTRFFRLRLTDNGGTQIPLVRVGGEGGLLDNAVTEGGVIGGYDTKYTANEILIDPGSRVDVVIAVPAAATGVLTLWTEDYDRTGQGFSDVPTVPVMHLSVSGSVTPYTISAGTPLRAATSDLVPVLSGPVNALLDPSTFSPAKLGLASQNIRLTQTGSALGVDDVFGTHDVSGDYTVAAHLGSTRYAKLGDTLELTVENTTGGAHHPYHLHGFSMQPISLTKTGGGGPDYVWPYHEFRDNIDVPPGYTLTFRIKITDRALADGTTMGGAYGRWLFHCHIFFHATNGMLGELVVVAPNGNEKPDVNANVTTIEAHHGDTATVHGTYHDIDGDAVTLSASVGTVADNGGGTWTWTDTVGCGDPSQFVYITATDAGGRKDQAVFFLKTVNTTPTLHLPGPLSQDYHDALSFGISATDPDCLDAVSLSASGLPAGLTFTDNGDRTGTVSGTITAAPDTYVVTFSADDHNGGTTTGTVTITVTREETTTTYTGPTVILAGGSGVTLSGKLLEDGTTVLVPPRTVTFTLGTQSCTGTTDGTGAASCTLTYTGPLGSSVPRARQHHGRHGRTGDGGDLVGQLVVEPERIDRRYRTLVVQGLRRGDQPADEHPAGGMWQPVDDDRRQQPAADERRPDLHGRGRREQDHEVRNHDLGQLRPNRRRQGQPGLFTVAVESRQRHRNDRGDVLLELTAGGARSAPAQLPGTSRSSTARIRTPYVVVATTVIVLRPGTSSTSSATKRFPAGCTGCCLAGPSPAAVVSTSCLARTTSLKMS